MTFAKNPVARIVLLQIPIFALSLLHTPKSRLDVSLIELLYLLVWLPFARARSPWKLWHKPWLLALIIPQFLFMLARYQIHQATVSVISLLLWLIPLTLWGLVRFWIWNARHWKDASSRDALIFSAISWGLFAFTYPPLPLGVAALVLLAPWFLVMRQERPDRVLFATFWSALIFHWLMYFWIINVAKVGPPIAIISGVFLLMAYFSLFYVIGAWFFVNLRDITWKQIPAILLFPFLWAGIEVLRSRGQISFPWGHLGYVFGNHVELLQGLSWIGVYGYSILILFSNMSLAHAIRTRRWAWAGVPVLILCALWGHGLWRLRETPKDTQAPAMRIAMVQPSIPQTRKWSKAYYDSVMTKTWSVLDTMNTSGVHLVVLPETAIPDFISLRPHEIARLRAFAREKQVDILVGALNYDRNGPPPRNIHYYNSAFYFTPSGDMVEYRKQRLVPFSEHLPFDGLIPAINYVDLGEGDFSPGTELPVFSAYRWTPNICYEAIYPDLMRELVHHGARMVINITNDGWFGKTTAPGQHANLVRYRAIETAMPVARCANSGISLFYDAFGRAYQRTRLYEVKSIQHALAPRNRVTFYTRFGEFWELFLAFLAASCFALIWSKRALHQVKRI